MRIKGEGTLFQRADGYWVGGVELPTTDGKRRQRRIVAKDRNTAIAKLKKLRTEVDEGRIPVTGKTTVEKWLDRWLNQIHVTQIRPTTRISYATTIRLYINPSVGSKRLDRLTPEHVRGLLKDARKVSTRAEQKSYIVLKRALDDAVKEGLITRNVVTVVHKPKHKQKEREPYTWDEAKELLSTALEADLGKGTRWVTAFFTGARQGEVLGLEWDHIDLEKGVIHFEWQLQQLQKVHGCGECHSDGTWPCGRNHRPGWCPQARWDFEPDFEYRVLHRSLALTKPKTKAAIRSVAMQPPLWVSLARHHQDHRGTNPHKLVWHHLDGRPIGPRDDYEEWQNLNKECDLPTPVSLHRARHTTATILRKGGMDEQSRMEILGHVSETAQRIYAHPDLESQRQQMSPLSGLLELDS